MSIPDDYRRTSAPPRTINQIVFHCYKGRFNTAWYSEDGRLRVKQRSGAETFIAWVDDEFIAGSNPDKAKRFRTMDAAMLAATFGLASGQGK